jgi:hypothetical protein
VKTINYLYSTATATSSLLLCKKRGSSAIIL